MNKHRRYSEPSEAPDLIDWDDEATLKEVVYSAARDYCAALSRRGDKESADYIRKCLAALEGLE